MPQNLKRIQQLLIPFNNQQVLVGRDVASLYGVPTKRINEAVKNNPDKFPEGYVIEISAKQKAKLVENFDQLKNMKYAKTIPKAYTEKGLYAADDFKECPSHTNFSADHRDFCYIACPAANGQHCNHGKNNEKK